MLFSSRTIPSIFILVALIFCKLASADITLTPTQFTQGKADTIKLQLSDSTDIQQLYLSPGGPIIENTWALTYPGEDLLWFDDLLYITTGKGGLLTLNIDDPQQILQSQLSFNDAIHNISISHDHAWIGADKGIYTVDIRDAATPRIRGFINTPQRVTAITSNDDYTVAATGTELRLFDSRKPGVLLALSTIQIKHPILGLTFNGNELFTADGDAGVNRFEITPQHQLLPMGHYQTTGPALDIEVNNGVAAVATAAEGLTLLSTSGDQLLWLGSHQQAGHVTKLFHEKVNQEVMLLNDEQQIMLIDISNPRLPTVISTYQLHNAITAVQFRDDQALVLNGNQLQQIDFSFIAPQYSNIGLNFGQGVNYGGERRIFIRDAIAYVADWFSGIHIFDISSPAKPQLLSTFHTEGSSKGIIVRDDYAYVGDDDHGLQIINIKDPRKPFRVSQLATSGLAYIPVLDGDRLYLAGHRGGFQIIDISDPKAPHLLGEYDTTGMTWSIRVRNDIAYIADDESGLMMFDVSHPDNIQLVGQFSPGGAAEDLILDNNVAYVAFFNRGVYVIDIKDPGYPKKLAHINTPGNARGLVRDDHYLYIADWLSGIQIYDVSTPNKPQFTGSYDTAGAAWGAAVVAPYAYVMDWWGGFTVLDISNPARPRLAGHYHQRDRVFAIDTRENVAYVASGKGGLQIYDIKNPLNPTWMTGVDFNSAAIAVASHNDRAYVATADKHIAIIDISNPFSAHTLREIKTRDPVVDIQTQGNWLLVDLGINGSTVYRIDGKYADKPKKKRHYKLTTYSALFDNGQILLATQADHTTATYKTGEKKPFMQAGLPAEILRQHRNLIISYSRETGISSIDQNGNIVGNLLTNMNIIDMQVRDTTLYLITDEQRLIAVDLSNPEKMLLGSSYPIPTGVNKITAGSHALYFSGERSILALHTLPAIDWSRLSHDEYQLTNAPQLPVGDYNLHINNTRYDNAVSVEIIKFSKPKFTMDDFNKALNKMKQQQ